MTTPAFLDDLWPDMCAAYRDPALASLCLDVQDNHDVDVPLLLVLCLADRAGHHIAAEDWAPLEIRSGEWREAAIQPLRQARRQMKDRFTAPAQLELREAIKRLELEAERLQVLGLAENFPPASNMGSAALSYLGARGVAPQAANQFVTIFNHACDVQAQRSKAKD